MSVSREESDSRTRICGNCRAKVAAGRTRCPRCSAVEAGSNPESDPAHSKRLAMISGTLLALALIALGVVYLQQPAETATVVPKSLTDPLAARRAASATAVAAAVEVHGAVARYRGAVLLAPVRIRDPRGGPGGDVVQEDVAGRSAAEPHSEVPAYLPGLRDRPPAPAKPAERAGLAGDEIAEQDEVRACRRASPSEQKPVARDGRVPFPLAGVHAGGRR